MTKEERNTERMKAFNKVYFLLQLGAQAIKTYGDFADMFAFEMKKSPIGSCTEEDAQWAMETLKHLEKKNMG